VKTTDTEAEFWLEPHGSSRCYCAFIQSKREGKYGSEKWKRSLKFLVRVEVWSSAEDAERGEDESLREYATEPTFQRALLTARRLADRIELEQRLKERRR